MTVKEFLDELPFVYYNEEKKKFILLYEGDPEYKDNVMNILRPQLEYQDKDGEGRYFFVTYRGIGLGISVRLQVFENTRTEDIKNRLLAILNYMRCGNG